MLDRCLTHAKLMMQSTEKLLSINSDISADDNNEEEFEDEDTESSKISTFLYMRLNLIRDSCAYDQHVLSIDRACSLNLMQSLAQMSISKCYVRSYESCYYIRIFYN
jgi:hypothetical protein